jgi:hypothetical protein
MTTAQHSYLDALARQAGEEVLLISAWLKPHSTSID